MNNLLSVVALSLVSLSLSAQPKPAVRKSAPVKHPATTQAAATRAAKPAPAANYTAPQTASVAPAPEPQQQPTTTNVASRTQYAPASRPAARTFAPASVDGSRFRIGFRVGGNSSTISGTDISALGPGVKLARVTGFHAGVMFNFGGPDFSVQPEILYTQYGVKVTDGTDYLQLKYGIVEVPVLLKASFGQSNVRFFVNAGPVATYTMNGKISVQESGQSGSKPLDLTGTGRFSFGATGGAGVAVQAGPGAVQIEARYTYLFSSNDDGAKINPQNAMLSIGYLIPIGR